VSPAKPFAISKRLVWEAYKGVKANQGAAGVDAESVEQFERKLAANLYKIWNRMSSGTYFPAPVRTVAIPKKDGGQRQLGIPTVADRIAQRVVALYLEPLVEPQFHPESYGYRAKRSAHQALSVARERCWRYDWVIDLDIRGFFDHLDHALVLRAVRKYTACRWVLLYIERWLTAPAQLEDGSLVARGQGTPQGGVVSPLLANIFLHLALDDWMRRTYPGIPFERYADDVIVHCQSEEQAQAVKRAIAARLAQCKLELHPDKTKIVYCKDDNRRGGYPNEEFTFLGYTFRPRRSKNRRGQYFVNFSPAVSKPAATKIRREMKRWRLHLRSAIALDDIARLCNPVVRGWINYYGRFYKSALRPVFRQFNHSLTRWAMRKFKRLRRRPRQAQYWLGRVARRAPQMFAHWELLGLRPTAG
jgi:RNA-directed DNA polymerase